MAKRSVFSPRTDARPAVPVRPPLLAILTFGLLIVANLSAFAYFYFLDFSKKVVTERLMRGLSEARSIMAQGYLHDMAWEPLQVSRALAPKLRQLKQFRAVLILDNQGHVIHREWIAAWQPTHQGRSSVVVPISNPSAQSSQGGRIALEYSPEDMDREVEVLRDELFGTMRIAIAVSLLLLAAACAYVLWAHRKNVRLQEQAQKADRMAYLGTLASGLAHEIRNPLNSMNMNIQLIEEELEEGPCQANAEVRDMFQSTRREIQRLERMVSSFLAYARPTPMEYRTLQPNTFLEGLLAYLQPELKAKHIQLETRFQEDLGEATLDENQLRQALMNVLQNAIQVMEPGKTLTVSTRTAGSDKILIAIQDQGPGMAPKVMEEAFKVFFSTRRGGTGLGLPIAQRIAEQHGGGLKLESEVGLGATVTFVLPKEPPLS